MKKIRTIEQALEELGFTRLSDVMQVALCSGGQIILDFHGASEEKLKTVFKVKDAMTPVTEADKGSGEAIRQVIRERYPQDAINEEESGFHEGINRIWYVDPLDGSYSFSRMQKYSSLGIAVYKNGYPMAAAIYHPFEKELLIAEKGKGAYLFSFILDENMVMTEEPERLGVSRNPSFENGVLYLDAIFNWKTNSRKLNLIRRLVRLANGNLNIRMTGSNIDQQRQVAKGCAEITITDCVGGFWDLAAGSLIIKEAGGEFCDVNGNPISEKTQLAIGGSEEIVEQALPILQECYKDYEGFR